MAFTTYSTWEYYSGTFHGELSQEQYLRESIRAAGMINRLTYGSAKTAPAEMAEALAICECEIVDVLFAFRQSFSQLPRGMRSINNDGFSASAESGYAQSTSSREEEELASAREICINYLLEPRNLMFSGI